MGKFITISFFGAIMATSDESRGATTESARITVDSIGGITGCEVEFHPGVTVLSGRNATNRTSLLTALTGVLGGEKATLKSDADSGEVELRLGERVYRRTYTRQGNTVSTSGTPLSDEPDLVDLFVGLVEGSETRRAVERGEDLREVIMRPVDTQQIREEIGERERERERIENELEGIERERSRLPGLEARRKELESDLEELAGDIEEVRDTVDEYETNEIEARRAESLLDEIDDRRQERERLRRDIETQRTSLEALRDEREEVEEDLESLEVDESSVDELDREIERLRTRKRELGDLISDLSAVVDVNDSLVTADASVLPGVENGTGSPSPTSALDPMAQEVECWTCGSEVPKRAIADRLEELREVIDDQREKRNGVVDDLEAAESQRAEIRAAVKERDRLEARLREIDRQVQRREERFESLREDRDRVREELEELETQLEENEELEGSELVEQYRRLSDLEYERGQLDQRLSEVEAEIDEVRDRADERERLAARRDELDDEIESLRSRIEDLERVAVEQFNDRMADLLDRLEYENVERVWIERKTDTGGRGEPSTTFDLHVVRESADGAVYEDAVETLSESEREVIGLVVALAGYLVHEVHEEIPFILLDSLEALDAERIDALLEYFSGYVPYLVVALLPEDADAIETAHERISAGVLAA